MYKGLYIALNSFLFYSSSPSKSAAYITHNAPQPATSYGGDSCVMLLAASSLQSLAFSF